MPGQTLHHITTPNTIALTVRIFALVTQPVRSFDTHPEPRISLAQPAYSSNSSNSSNIQCSSSHRHSRILQCILFVTLKEAARHILIKVFIMLGSQTHLETGAGHTQTDPRQTGPSSRNWGWPLWGHTQTPWCTLQSGTLYAIYPDETPPNAIMHQCDIP